MHIVLGYQRAFALLDPGELDLLMPVQMRIEMRQYIFLYDDSLVVWDRDGELQYFHAPNIRILRILSIRGLKVDELG